MTNADYTALLIVLDRSGSMRSIRDDMVGGLEQMLAEHAAEPGKLTVNVVLFDDRIETTHEFADPADVNIVLEPRGMTALHDAMGFAITDFGAKLAAMPEHERPANVQVVVVTDGHENASRRYTAAMVAEMVRQQTQDYNWDFLFLGADQDAVLTARDLGIRADKAMTYGRGRDNVAAMSVSVSAKLRSTRGGRRDDAFTAEERRAAAARRAAARNDNR
jgi:hypothetical protein